LKTKKRIDREVKNPVIEAYLRQLREFNQTKAVYDINPYVEVYRFRDRVYSIFSESLDGMGDPWIHLIVGPERAMVIDNGFGLGDLKGVVDRITGGLPVIAAVTHCHFDHSYGSFQFESVHCHKNEVQRMEKTNNPHIWDYLFDENGRGRWAEFDRDDLVPYRNLSVAGCENGHLFDLGGGHEVELVFLPGHTVGHAGYLDRKNRILFAGDTACFGVIGIRGPDAGETEGRCASVTALRDELAKLVCRKGEFDRVFPGHSVLDLDTSVIDRILDTCNAIVNDPENYDGKEGESGGRERYLKAIAGFGSLRYSRESV